MARFGTTKTVPIVPHSCSLWHPVDRFQPHTPSNQLVASSERALMSASLNTLVDCALTKTVIAKENTDKFVIGGLLKVGSTTILLLREGVVEDRGGR